MMWEELVKQVGNRMRLDRRVLRFPHRREVARWRLR